jgi:hypothetical protein
MLSEYDQLLSNITITDNPFEQQLSLPTLLEPVIEYETERLPLFTVEKFISQLKKESHLSNKSYHNNSNNINAYDIASQCARVPFFRINNYPVSDYSSSWLPISMRGVIGTACHDFIQSVKQTFTETEVCLKIPSMQVSVRTDALINDDTVVEIKSCTYSDYDAIIKTNAPRNSDFYQSVFYKYLLENKLEEAKTQQPTRNGTLPRLSKYNIRYIQLIYICHELISSDEGSISDDVKFSKDLKRKLESKKNPFWFLTVLTIDLNSIDIELYENYILDKYSTIKASLDSNVIIPMSNRFIDLKGCYFCVYNKVCNQYP